MDLNRKLRDLLSGMGADLVGFGDVSGLAPDGYKTAVVAAIALPPEIIDEIPVGPRRPMRTPTATTTAVWTK